MPTRRAHDLFNHWLLVTRLSKKPKTIDKFLKSPQRNLFVEFERAVTSTYLPSGKAYLEWLVGKGVRSREWTKPEVLQRYKLEHAKDQDPRMVVMRNLEVMAQWCDEQGIGTGDFFSKITPGTALDWIEAGKLTPWVMLNTDHIDKLVDRMDELQLDRFSRAVDVLYWEARLKVSEDTAPIKEILREMGL